MKETFKIKDLEQIRLLSDPLKLQLLQAFAEKAQTAKEVAARLGESVTKLYRHVDALQAAGLLEVTREQRKRGTVERTFRAVATRFEADHSLFVDDDDSGGQGAMRELLRAGEAEILQAVDAAGQDGAMQPIVLRLRCKASRERIGELAESLLQWVQSVEAENGAEEDTEEAGALIAFYPIQRSKA